METFRDFCTVYIETLVVLEKLPVDHILLTEPPEQWTRLHQKKTQRRKVTNGLKEKDTDRKSSRLRNRRKRRVGVSSTFA